MVRVDHGRFAHTHIKFSSPMQVPAAINSNTGPSRYTTRIQLKGFLANPRFFIRTMEIQENECFLVRLIKKIHGYFWYVSLQVEGRPLLININSLAKRLLLPNSEIRAAARHGQLEQLIQNCTTGGLINTLSTAYCVYSNDGSEPLFLPHSSEETHLTIDKLRALAGRVDECLKLRFDEIRHHGIFLESEGKEYLIGLNQEHRLHIILYTGGQHMEGGMSFTQKVFNIATAEFEVLKQAINSKPNSVELLKREVCTLDYIAQKGPQPFFQSKPSCYFDIEFPNNERFLAYSGKWYPGGDFSNWFTTRLPEGHINKIKLFNQEEIGQMLQYCKQLMEIFRIMHLEYNLGHGDLKAENIYLDEMERFVVGDWGSARKFDDPIPPAWGDSWTPDSRSRDDYIKQKRAWYAANNSSQSKKSQKNAVKDFNMGFQPRDMFAIGSLFFYILSGGYEAYSDNNCMQRGYLSQSTKFEEMVLHKCGYSQEIIDLVRNMLNHDSAMLPTTQEAAANWRNMTVERAMAKVPKYSINL